MIDADQAQALLDEAIHVLAAIGSAGAGRQPLCLHLRRAARPVRRDAARATEAPVRDMDEAMETFGAGPDGIEPLLRRPPRARAVHFYPAGRPPADRCQEHAS